MSTSQSGNKTHDDAVAKAESIRQSASVPGTAQATVKAADIGHYRSCLSSALANGINPTCFIQALRDLGTGGM